MAGGTTKFGLAMRNFTAFPELPDTDALLDYAVRAEELGFESLWVWDHILLGVDPHFPIIESLTLLTAAAARTSRIKLGTGVLVLPLRNPVVLAKVLASLDQISKGRLILGVASGWYAREFDAVGVPFKRRGKVMDQNLEVLTRLLQEDSVRAEYPPHNLRSAVQFPKPLQKPRPPILVGGYVDAVLKRAAVSGDGWLTYFYTPENFTKSWNKVKAFAREPFEGRKFGRAADFLFDRSFAASRIQAINSPLQTGLWMAALVATIWIGGIKVVHQDMSVGQLTSFLIYIQLLQLPIRGLGWMVMMVPRAATSSQRIFEILDQESDVQERQDAYTPVNPQGHIRFEHVSFAYDEERPVLREVDFEAHPGQVIALLGPTGSGKTTVVNLLPRFYDVTGGRVLLDGDDIRDLTLESLREQVAIVQQDVFLFAASIHDNIAYGRPDATDEEVRAAAQLARIHDHIMGLPGGYDTWVGERGATLSGGQKQRMAIARALLMDPRVLIFDDSTSSVDAATEFEIQQAMSALMQGRTTFVIAHRLRSVKDADQILVLDQGVIVQSGTHNQLLAQGGLYRDIYDLELRDQEEAYGQTAGGAGA